MRDWFVWLAPQPIRALVAYIAYHWLMMVFTTVSKRDELGFVWSSGFSFLIRNTQSLTENSVTEPGWKWIRESEKWFIEAERSCLLLPWWHLCWTNSHGATRPVGYLPHLLWTPLVKEKSVCFPKAAGIALSNPPTSTSRKRMRDKWEVSELQHSPSAAISLSRTSFPWRRKFRMGPK